MEILGDGIRYSPVRIGSSTAYQAITGKHRIYNMLKKVHLYAFALQSQENRKERSSF